MQQQTQQQIQQQMHQQEQLGVQQLMQQQMQQQMVLCPVRVVYETQILMPPGDQMQPNQTLFINPQNTPPWAQNRQMQNPVIYVQQLPNNMMATMPQHMDQNQLYLQHYQNYQQIMPQQIMTQQNQDQRHMQLPNMIPQNILQNYQTNINPNVSNVPERTLPQAYGTVQNIATNMSMQQAQANVASNNLNNRNDSNIQSLVQAQQQQQPQSQFSNHKVEIRPGIFMNVGQQINQHQVRPPPQVLTVNPIQNQVQNNQMPNIPQTATTSANVQAMPPNLHLPRQVQMQSVGSQMSPNFVNSPNTLSRIRKVAPNTVNKVTNTSVGPRQISQNYRPIQPRPQQYRNTAPNYTTVEKQPISVSQNIINVNSTLPTISTIQPIVPHNPSYNISSYIKPEENSNININRKRKSESPDEIHKKMAAIQVNITTPIKPVSIPQRSFEVGIHTNPVNKIEIKPNPTFNINPPIYQQQKTDIPNVELKKISTLIENVQQAIQTDKGNVSKPAQDIQEAGQATEKDKLVRNTVFTQARGRLLTDKDSPALNVLETKNIPKIETNVKVPQVPNEVKTESVQTPSVEIKLEKRDDKAEMDSLNTGNNKGMVPMNRGNKQERDFVLTHVLDGIVIQESNIAFPIREPALRRSMHQSQVANQEKLKKEEVKEPIKSEEVKKEATEETVTNIDVKEVKKDDEETSDEENPFANLNHTTVKSWKIEDLASNLSKQNWGETAALFVEHEIDGESLYLVSKPQLLTIGVKENHADIICAFVKS